MKLYHKFSQDETHDCHSCEYLDLFLRPLQGYFKDWQINQAEEAVKLFLLEKNYNLDDCRTKLSRAAWQYVYNRALKIFYLQRISPNTEKLTLIGGVDFIVLLKVGTRMI